jgi:hypothetical protein
VNSKKYFLRSPQASEKKKGDGKIENKKKNSRLEPNLSLH